MGDKVLCEYFKGVVFVVVYVVGVGGMVILIGIGLNFVFLGIFWSFFFDV